MQSGTVVRRTRSHYYVDLGEGSPRLCRIRSNLFHHEPKESRIAVGDEVRVDFQDSNDTGWIL
ncbi:MAG: ribosome small subunit-dependent GTPase, partial [SAR324 cluster bacterium]|nr:ribosome small subunit-dependent GTPase [SAR324 cluster bacterium]